MPWPSVISWRIPSYAPSLTDARRRAVAHLGFGVVRIQLPARQFLGHAYQATDSAELAALDVFDDFDFLGDCLGYQKGQGYGVLDLQEAGKKRVIFILGLPLHSSPDDQPHVVLELGFDHGFGSFFRLMSRITGRHLGRRAQTL